MNAVPFVHLRMVSATIPQATPATVEGLWPGFAFSCVIAFESARHP